MRVMPLDETEKKLWLNLIEEKSIGKTAKILFSFGSIISGDVNLIESMFQIFAKDQKRLYIVSKGAKGDQIDLDSNNMIGSNQIPQTFLLQQVDLAIIHGGNNGITECLYYGIPMVVMPLLADQYDNAQRIQAMNYGRRLDLSHFTEAKLMSLVDELLTDRQIRLKVNNIGCDMRSKNESARAGELINTLAENGHLDEATRRKFGITM